MFGIGETELVIIVVFAFMLFGPDKLPGMGRTLGRVLRQFREASDGFTEVVQTNIMDPASEELEKSPKQRKREASANLAEEDADAAAGETEEATAPKRETFAERKARLMAERKAAEEAAATESASVDEEEPQDDEPPVSAGDVDSDDDLPEAPLQQPEEDKARQKATASTSAADLYAMTSQRSSRSRAKESTTGEGDGNDEA